MQNFLEPRKEPHEGVVLENKVRNAVQSYLNEVYHQTRPNQSNPAYLPQPAFRPKLELDTTTKFEPQYRGQLSLILIQNFIFNFLHEKLKASSC